MFTTIEDVKAFTGYDVTGPIVVQAQSIIESYIGRSEVDITDPRDLEILSKATAFQAAYMKDNYARTFQQVALQQMTQNSGVITFKPGDNEAPWLAPLAKMACKHLTFRRSRGVRTGKVFKRGKWYSSRDYYDYDFSEWWYQT